MQSHIASAVRPQTQSNPPATTAATRKELAAQVVRDLQPFVQGGAIYATAARYPGYFFERSVENIVQGLTRAVGSLRKSSDVTRPTIASDVERLRRHCDTDTFFFRTISKDSPSNARVLTALGKKMDAVVAALRA